jgi:ATP-dependent DNA helicase PIF1
VAWALTIHKSQGSTLDIAEVDVGEDIFECGQTYVALSRVKSLEGLYLTSFDVTKVKINKKVQDFYKLLK